MPPHSQQLLTQIDFGDHMGDHMGTLKVSRKNRVCKVMLCFIDPRVRKIRNEASSCTGIFSTTLRFHYVASFPGSPLPHRCPKRIALWISLLTRSIFESRSPLRMRIWILIIADIGTGVDKCLLVRHTRQRPFKRLRILSSSNSSTVWYAPSLIMYVWFHVRVAAKYAFTRLYELAYLHNWNMQLQCFDWFCCITQVCDWSHWITQEPVLPHPFYRLRTHSPSNPLTSHTLYIYIYIYIHIYIFAFSHHCVQEGFWDVSLHLGREGSGKAIVNCHRHMLAAHSPVFAQVFAIMTSVA